MRKHKGSCHCGRVTFELCASVCTAIECNCSICQMKGAIWYITDAGCFRIGSGRDKLGLYQFGTMTARHYFCTNCGICPFYQPRVAPAKWAVNLQCVEDLDLASVEIRFFDGENWEAAAQEWSHAEF